jgi:hypothetical protein
LGNPTIPAVNAICIFTPLSVNTFAFPNYRY